MNKKKYKLNSLLKLALFFSIIFGVASCGSAQTDSNNIFARLNYLLTTKGDLTFVDLSFINLIITVTFFLLWFLNKSQQQKQLNRVVAKQKQIENRLKELKESNIRLNDIEKIKNEIIKQAKENNQKIIDSKIEILGFFNKEQVNYYNSDRNYSDFNFNTNSYSLNSNISNLNSIVIIDKVSQFVDTYNQDRNSISEKAKFMVAETQASLNQRRSGSSDTVTLENTSQKKYCIIEEDSDNYLVPHAKIKFDDFNKSTLESLFYCTNFTSDYSDFQLVKPAKVSQIDLETWQLEEKGKLDFS